MAAAAIKTGLKSPAAIHPLPNDFIRIPLRLASLTADFSRFSRCER
jgi:hypothetical protein